MRYRRAFVPGGSFFFTVVTARRRPILASAAAVAVLREAVRTVRSRRPFTIDAMVVLPDHIHCIWTLPAGDADFATRWRLIKTWFTKHGPDERGAWQHRYWEHQLRDEADFARHVEYIHFNPVKHGLAAAAIEWPYSSFRRYVAAGVYPPDWGRDVVEVAGVGRE
jgi:putative transposase